MKVRALYDFDAQNKNELSVAAGEEVTVVNQHVGSGWWQAVNSAGVEGLVPLAFMEVVDLPEPTIPPPPPPFTEFGREIDMTDDWDEEWDSDDGNNQSMIELSLPQSTQVSLRKHSESFYIPPAQTDNVALLLIRKMLPRQFIRTGGEEFLLSSDFAISHVEAVVEFVHDTFQWRKPLDQLNCIIESFRKDSKMKGMKSFITYQLSSSFCPVQVSRRFKHFDWLHARLSNKYPCICVPPLPDKVLTNRYECEFVDERRKLLQRWLLRMCRHPIISRSSVFLHFLTCRDFKKWKIGKREAETDRFQGGRFFYAIQSTDPQTPQDLSLGKLDSIERFLTDLDRTTRSLCDTFVDFHRRVSGYQKNFSGISAALIGLSKVFNLNTHTKLFSESLCTAMHSTGETYRSIAISHSVMPEASSNLLECIREWTRLLPLTCNLINLAKPICQLIDELDRQTRTDETKIGQTEVNNLLKNSTLVTRALQAEFNVLFEQLLEDWSRCFQDYLMEQAKFYRQMANHFELAAQKFH